jgi:hypothetical protein
VTAKKDDVTLNGNVWESNPPGPFAKPLRF